MISDKDIHNNEQMHRRKFAVLVIKVFSFFNISSSTIWRNIFLATRFILKISECF